MTKSSRVGRLNKNRITRELRTLSQLYIEKRHSRLLDISIELIDAGIARRNYDLVGRAFLLNEVACNTVDVADDQPRIVERINLVLEGVAHV